MSAGAGCPACRRPVADTDSTCPHCDLALGRHESESLFRTAAFGLAAAIMLVPAYTLPVMSISRLGHAHADTIFSSVWKLWQKGMWGLALIVFTASLLVPVLKLSGLALLLAAARWPRLAPSGTLRRLHGILHVIGRWSMLDIFLVAFLCGIVRFGGLASVEARPGALAFALVVVLTILATSFYHPPPAHSATPVIRP